MIELNIKDKDFNTDVMDLEMEDQSIDIPITSMRYTTWSSDPYSFRELKFILWIPEIDVLSIFPILDFNLDSLWLLQHGKTHDNRHLIEKCWYFGEINNWCLIKDIYIILLKCVS